MLEHQNLMRGCCNTTCNELDHKPLLYRCVQTPKCKAISAAFLFIRCAAIDPTNRTRFKMKRKNTQTAFSNVNYGFVLGQIIVRFIRRIERRVLKTFIRRKYQDPLKSSLHLEPLLTFPLLVKDDLVAPQTKDDDISFCSLCDFEVKERRKHCRTCNRCVEEFDHHCRWLNNYVGSKNYTSFIFLMIFLLTMLLIEGGTTAAIFVKCFANKRSIELKIQKRFNANFPRGVLAIICVVLFFMTSYCLAALGQLFLFHIVLIRKAEYLPVREDVVLQNEASFRVFHLYQAKKVQMIFLRIGGQKMSIHVVGKECSVT